MHDTVIVVGGTKTIDHGGLFEIVDGRGLEVGEGYEDVFITVWTRVCVCLKKKRKRPRCEKRGGYDTIRNNASASAHDLVILPAV